jgi:hypothetical protein
VKRLTPWLLAVLALAGCSKSTARPGAKFQGPQGVAVFRGYAIDQPGALRSLVAVANTHGDDLRLVDAVSNKVLSAPTQVAALSVPTEPRPSLIASGRLHDVALDGSALARADLLVVAPRSQVSRPLPAPAGTFGAVIQSVVTWEERTRVDATVDLGDLVPDAALTSLLVVPVPELVAGAWRPKPGAARVLACTTDGFLVSIEATRDAATEAIHLALPVAQPLGFACLDLAVSSDGTRVYAASLDPVPAAGGVLGVAELDNTAPAGAMPVRAIPARLGTTQVAAIDVAPFLANDPAVPELDLFGPAAPRVYAVLDPSACGVDRSMPCGIAVIDPVAGGLAPDPAGELPYQLPIQIPGEVVDIAVAGPPAHTDRAGYLKFDPGTGMRWTTAIAGVSTTSGRIYLVDLAHFSVGSVVAALTGPAPTRVISSGSTLPSTGSADIGLWSRPLTGAPTLQFGSLAAPGVAVTPGYTSSDTFIVTYQGILPGLMSRQALAHVTSGAPTWIAIQEATGLTAPGTSRWRGVARLYDPRLAVRIGDLVQVHGFPSGACSGGTFDLEITSLLPPGPLYPGGAVAVVPSPTQPAGADPACLPPGTDSTVTVSFRAAGLVLAGAITGYAGRPEIVLGAPESATPFELKYQDEGLLSCPIMPDDPQAWPPAAADVAACEAAVATCRATCEQLVLARRARRAFYVTEACPSTTTALGQACHDLWVTGHGLQFPLPKGPALAFRVGITDPAQGLTLKRGATFHFSTGSGLSHSARTPSAGVTGSGSTAAYGVTFFDRSAATGAASDAIHGYAAFADNLVLDFAPWSGQAVATTIR